jgi:hypothetical protein
MRASVVALLSATIAATALGCAPPDDERCGDSEKYTWDPDSHSCFERGKASDTPTVDTTPSTNTDIDTDITGLGDDCFAFGTGNGCEGKDAGICAYFWLEEEGKCTVSCRDTANHSDCPQDWYCCAFVTPTGYTICLPSPWWDQTGPATCSNK